MEDDSRQKQSTPIWGIGLVGILVALAGSLVLVLSALGFSATLPGCGPESGCARITSGPWSALPLLGWPLSFIGLAFFGGLFIAWLRGAPSPSVLWFMRLGILASVGLVLVMVFEDAFCKWCLVTHLGNLVAWITAETLARRTDPLPASGLARGVIGFVVITIALAIIFPIRLGAIEQHEAERLAASQSAITAGTNDLSTLALLESTHKLGPDDAPVQVVMFTDYQCPDCNRLEGQMSRILEERDDVSLAIKHFPFCAACNEHTNGMTMHPNACWAARAAEAASILGGNDGFWRMHEWLFEERGSFTDATFPGAIRALGFDPSSFIPVMMSQETLDTVRTDTDAAVELGVFFTPMIFINGVEYTWYFGGQDSLARTVDIVARSNRPVVAPVDARERLFEDWRIGHSQRRPGTASSSWLGEGVVEVVVYGDYQSEFSRRLDRIVRALQAGGSPIRYTWRHYPLETAGNSSQSHAGSDGMARAVEAARNLAGDDARWSTHAWLIEGPPPTSEDQLARTVAERIGVDAARMQAEMKSPTVSSRLARDMADKSSTWSNHLPVLVIDERLVPRWSSDDVPAEELIERIISTVRGESAGEG